MAKLERGSLWIQEEITTALAGEAEELSFDLTGKVVSVTGRLVVDGGDPEETRAFLEALAAEAVPGYEVRLEGLYVSRGVPDKVVSILRKCAQDPSDLFWIRKISDKPLVVHAQVRHQEKMLGKKRTRIEKARELLAAEGCRLEVSPLGKQFEVNTLRTLPLLQEWLAPLLAGSPLSPGDVHGYRADANAERLHLIYDAEVEPDALRPLARKILRSQDVEVTFERKMSRVRAREAVDAAFGAVKNIEGFHLSFQEKGQVFVVTVDTEQSNAEVLRELATRLERQTQHRVLVQIDVARDVMVSRLANAFPEDGILTHIKHVDGALYDVEALIPFDDGNTRINAWSDEMEALWGVKVMISDPFLWAPDVRYRYILGDDAETIAKRYNRPMGFSAEAQAVADQTAVYDLEAEAKHPKRRDIRQTIVLSIDPERTRDIDDALSIEEKEPGIYEVGIHIADVAHFVPQGSALDHEAMMRGFTTYLKEGEIPVLPFVLANGACSLHGDQDRLALSVFARLTEDGELLDFDVAKTVIHNHCRFAYAGAQAILDGADHRFAWQVRTLGALSQTMRKNRKAAGSLDLSLEADPEKPSHQLIEEFMLLANECVGRFLRERHPEHVCISRVHPDVTEANFEGLDKLSERFRLGVKVRNQTAMQKLLETALDTDVYDIIRFHVGRVLEKAVYHVEQLGHGALAKEDYAHFTSPIRRYTDLIIHRLIEDVLFAEERGGASSYEKDGLRAVIDHLNHMEVRVDAGSFESHRLSDLQQYDGARRTYDARILSLMKGWCWLKLHQTDLLVKVRYRDFDNHELMPVTVNDELSGRWLSLGDEVRVRTEGVDWSSKSIKASIVGGA